MKHHYCSVIITAEAIVKKLRPHCRKIEIAGSLRRREEMVKDIEIVCVPKCYGSSKRRIAEWHNAVYSLGKILKGKLRFGKYLQILLPNGIRLDLFVVEPSNFGMQFLLRTGPENYSRHILYCFNQLGYESKNGYPTGANTRLEFWEETAVFDYLDKPFVPPQKR